MAFLFLRFWTKRNARAARRITPNGIAIPMPIFAPVPKPPELDDDEGDGVGLALASVGLAPELEGAWEGSVEVLVEGEDESEDKNEEDAVRVAAADEVAEARLVSPLARSTAENGNGWRLLVSPELQQSPWPPAQHQLSSLQRLTSVRPLNSPYTIIQPITGNSSCMDSAYSCYRT